VGLRGTFSWHLSFTPLYGPESRFGSGFRTVENSGYGRSIGASRAISVNLTEFWKLERVLKLLAELKKDCFSFGQKEHSLRECRWRLCGRRLTHSQNWPNCRKRQNLREGGEFRCLFGTMTTKNAFRYST
jgi:hypothetical protein